MFRAKELASNLVVGVLLLAGVLAFLMLDFRVWKLKHPTAPVWTYWWGD